METPSQAPSLIAADSTLEGQLREMYGRVVYTQKSHEKMADQYVWRYKALKLAEVTLSSVSAGSLLLAVFGENHAGTVIGALLSTLLLGLLLFFKEAAMGETAQRHSEVGAKLWGMRERLLSLLVDMKGGQPAGESRRKRDLINEQLEQIYRSAPRTNNKAYAAAQVALKSSEELFFSQAELDYLLPEALRSSQG